MAAGRSLNFQSENILNNLLHYQEHRIGEKVMPMMLRKSRAIVQ
jgi:hypothetical protein